MARSQRIIRNVLVSITRMLLTVGLSVYTTRLYYQALTDTDIGIFSVLGASVALLAVLTDGLSSSAVRHLSYAVENEEHGSYAEFANTTYAVFLVVGLVLFLLGQALTPLLGFLSIPEDRREVAFWVYQVTVFSAVRATIWAPITAVFISRQAIALESVIAIALQLFSLGVVALLFVLPGDRLFNFVMLTLAVRVLIGFVQMAVCFVAFPDARIRPSQFRRSLVQKIAGFAGWTTLAATAATVRSRGIAVLLNLYFGPATNAALDAAVRLVTYLSNGLDVFKRALSPAIITAEGAGRRPQVIQLTLATCRYSTLAVLCVAVPIVLDAENVMRVWLDDPPALAAVFAVLMIATVVIDAMTCGCPFAIQATGRIGSFFRAKSMLSLLSLPVSWCALERGFPEQSVLVVTVTLLMVIGGVNLRYAGARVGLAAADWLKGVALPVGIVAAVGGVCATAPRLILTEGLGRLLAIAVSYGVASLATAWLVAIPAEEKRQLLSFALPTRRA